MSFYHPSNKPIKPDFTPFILKQLLRWKSLWNLFISFVVAKIFFVDTNKVYFAAVSFFVLIVLGSFVKEMIQYAKNVASHKEYQEGAEKRRIQYEREEEQRNRIRHRQIDEKRKREKKRKNRLTELYGEDIANRILKNEIWLDMSREMLIESIGQPEDVKENVSRDEIKEKWYYRGRITRQKTKVYELEVRLSNNLVEGWKEL